MDFLEHVTAPGLVVAEISRVLRPGGLFFFHTFNRNPLAHLVIIKLVEYLVANTPKNLHVIELFVKPKELTKYCADAGLLVQEMVGIRPKFSSLTLKSLMTRTVPTNFSFKLTKSTLLSYMGYARKNN
jgi:2-polyprenyl-6-hydroxyphenyl methylase/3-demethylubiquinone-9 3-methyltransferase